jgi:hypothetical protein
LMSHDLPFMDSIKASRARAHFDSVSAWLSKQFSLISILLINCNKKIN